MIETFRRRSLKLTGLFIALSINLGCEKSRPLMDQQSDIEARKLNHPTEKKKLENPTTTTAQTQDHNITSHSQTGGFTEIRTDNVNIQPVAKTLTDEHFRYFKLFIDEAKRKGPISLSQMRSLKVEVACISGDPEAHRFAEEIKDLLNSVGFNATGISQSAFDQSFTGIRVVIKPNTPDTRFAGMIYNGLGIIRLPVESVFADYVKNDIEIEVGHKPQGKSN